MAVAPDRNRDPQQQPQGPEFNEASKLVDSGLVGAGGVNMPSFSPFGQAGFQVDFNNTFGDLEERRADAMRALSAATGQRVEVPGSGGLSQAEIQFKSIDMMYQLWNKKDAGYTAQLGQALELSGDLQAGSYLPGNFSDPTFYQAVQNAAFEAAAHGMSPEQWIATKAEMYQRQQAELQKQAEAEKAKAKAQGEFDALVDKYRAAYFDLWGTVPPPGLAEKSARSMNIYEFVQRERRKPEWKSSHRGQVERIGIEARLARLLGSAV